MTTTPAKRGTPPRKSLIGLCFHTFDQEPGMPKAVQEQGQVVAQISPEIYLVQLYEWFLGQPSTKKLVSLQMMLTWEFYDTHEDMNAKYEEIYKPRAEAQARRVVQR